MVNKGEMFVEARNATPIRMPESDFEILSEADMAGMSPEARARVQGIIRSYIDLDREHRALKREYEKLTRT